MVLFCTFSRISNSSWILEDHLCSFNTGDLVHFTNLIWELDWKDFTNCNMMIACQPSRDIKLNYWGCGEGYGWPGWMKSFFRYSIALPLLVGPRRRARAGVRRAAKTPRRQIFQGIGTESERSGEQRVENARVTRSDVLSYPAILLPLPLLLLLLLLLYVLSP